MEKVEEVFGVAYDGKGGDPLPFSRLRLMEFAAEAVHYGSDQEHKVVCEVSNR